MIRFTLLFCLFSMSVVALAQSDLSSREDYEKRTRQQKIGQHHIPSDLIDAMKTLDEITPEDSKESYAAQSEDFVVERLFFSLGRWLAINWGMYDGSRFSRYLQNLGVDQPDGQKELVMRAYHRHLNGKELDVRDLVTRYKVQKAVKDSIRLSGAEVIDSYTLPAKDSLNRG
ncbi:MAG: DUF6794 domain-containing protein [Saprospiraceae bacterium]